MARLGAGGWWKAAALVVGLSAAAGCANRNRDAYGSSAYPDAPPRTVIAEPGAYDGVYVQNVVEQPAADGVMGYETLSDGSQVTVVTYVHTYPEPIESYPQVYWSGRWYYNVNGDFVYYSDPMGVWVYYWGPPAPLVACWNGYYPYSPYYWGTGYYGSGWYWGGVGVYGYHAYGLPVVNQYHHHHHHHHHDSQAGGQSGSRPNAGGPTSSPSPGGPTSDDPRRTKVADATSPARPSGDPTRKLPAASEGPTRTRPDDAGRTGADDPSRTRPDDGGRPGAGTEGPTRTRPGADAGTEPARIHADAGARVRPEPRQPAPTRNEYTTAGGQRITVVDPASRPSRAPARTPVTFQASPDTTFRAPPRAPSWGQPVARPSRDAAPAPSRTSPSRSAGPSSSPTPSRTTAPSWSPPSRTSPSPSRSTPSRSSSPSRSTPSRSSSSPSRSTPSRSSSSPSRKR